MSAYTRSVLLLGGIIVNLLSFAEAYDLTETFSVGGILAGVYQYQFVDDADSGDDEGGGAVVFQPELSFRPTDRDEFVAGIPIFAQLANALADAGYLVVRYDERGAGQSGGRQESATLQEFAADARAVVTYLSKRRDVDPRRIALVGYGEGGWISLLVGERENKVAAIGLVAAPMAGAPASRP